MLIFPIIPVSMTGSGLDESPETGLPPAIAIEVKTSAEGTTTKTDTLSMRATRKSAIRIPLRPAVKTFLEFGTTPNDLGIAHG
jgi:hypothetical protein